MARRLGPAGTRLPVGGRLENQPLDSLERPVLLDQRGGQIVEHLGMGRRIAPQAKIARRVDQRVFEVVHPNPIDDHPGRERIVAAGDRPGQFQPSAAVLERLPIVACEHRQKLPGHFRDPGCRSCRAQKCAARLAAGHRPASSRRPAPRARRCWPARRTANSSRPWESGRTCDRGSGRRSRSGPSCRGDSTSNRSSMMSCMIVEKPPADGQKTHRLERGTASFVEQAVGGDLLDEKLVVGQVLVQRRTTQSRYL